MTARWGDPRARPFHVVDEGGNSLAEIRYSDGPAHEAFRLVAEGRTSSVFREVSCHWPKDEATRETVSFTTTGENSAGKAVSREAKWGGWLVTRQWYELLAADGALVGSVEWKQMLFIHLYSSGEALVCRPRYVRRKPPVALGYSTNVVTLMPEAESQLDARLLLLWVAHHFGNRDSGS
ncbi:MAG: hypothetical protein ABMA26_11510 [Limisphaerales bacterium]